MSVYESIYLNNSFSASQQKILEIIGHDKKVLEIGSASGYMTRALKAANCVVDIIEPDKSDFEKAKKFARNGFNCSFEQVKLSDLKQYDFVIMADVLEHVVDPVRVLIKVKQINCLNLIISMPNIASWPMRKQLLLEGNFQYTDSGVLDRTHLHFYTPKSLGMLVSECGFKVEKIYGTVIFLPLMQTLTKMFILRFLFRKIYANLASRFPNLAYFHFVMVAKK